MEKLSYREINHQSHSLYLQVQDTRIPDLNHGTTVFKDSPFKYILVLHKTHQFFLFKFSLTYNKSGISIMTYY